MLNYIRLQASYFTEFERFMLFKKCILKFNRMIL